MVCINLTNAKAHLSALVERAASGEVVCITRHGKPVARIVSVPPDRKPIDIAALHALTATMRYQEEPARDFMRRIRDEDRY